MVMGAWLSIARVMFWLSIITNYMNVLKGKESSARKHAGCSIHAEVATYYSVPSRFRNNVNLLVIRSGLRYSKPCPKCQEFAAKKKVTIYYSDIDGSIVKFK